jgi:Terminase RNaseH-like domain
VRALSAFTVRPAAESGDKLTRFGPFSSQCRVGKVKFLRGPWNEGLFRVLQGFPDLAHDDEVDACSGALEMPLPQTSRCRPRSAVSTFPLDSGRRDRRGNNIAGTRVSVAAPPTFG